MRRLLPSILLLTVLAVFAPCAKAASRDSTITQETASGDQWYDLKTAAAPPPSLPMTTCPTKSNMPLV